MKRSIFIIGIGFIVLSLVFMTGIKFMGKNKDKKVLVYGMGTKGWGPLFPAQQSSLYAALIISHVFDSLVGVDNTGGFVPNLAKTWDVNEDRTEYTFVLDTTRKFSDGTNLTAEVYKDSLLDSLKLEAAATNKSALDVLYALEGYEDFKKMGEIKGLIVEGNDLLKFKFKKPYRGAIDQLSGTRYAVYKKVGDNYIGTGAYIYKKIEDGRVELEVNKYYPHEVPIKKVLINDSGSENLYKGLADVILPVKTSLAKGADKNIKTEKLSSLLGAHSLVVVNGIKGNIFADRNLRKAAQYIVSSYFNEEYAKKEKIPFFDNDIQFYPDFFPGHLSYKEVEHIVNEGVQYVNELRKVSLKKPIECISRPTATIDYCSAFKEYGIKVNQKVVDFDELRHIMYRGFNADLLSFGASYASADPDGIYHFLGKNGAIWSPMISRPVVEDLLEEGRSLISTEKIDFHYQKVARAILEEVPAIHLARWTFYLEYDSDRIEPVKLISGKRKALNVTLLKWR